MRVDITDGPDMKRSITLFTVLLALGVLYGASPGSATEDTSEFERLFSTNVRIVDYTLSPDEARVRLLRDNRTRRLTVGDNEFPFPDLIHEIAQIRENIAGVLRLSVMETDPGHSDSGSTRRWVWFFDPATQTFSRYEARCGESPHWRRWDQDRTWVYFADPTTGQTRLCERETGRLSAPLPSGISWDASPPISTGPLRPFTSDDGQWVLALGEDENITIAYSYNPATDTILELGAMPCTYCIELRAVRWFGSTVMIWSVQNIETRSEHIIYSADMNRAHSLRAALSRTTYLPEFYDDPPRYDYVDYTIPDDWADVWATTCQHVIFDVNTQQRRVTDKGPLCHPEYGDLHGLGYYRDVSRGAEGIVGLTAFDARTQEREILYEGEIEWIEWVSDDERYAVVALDDNGRVDALPFLDPGYWNVPDTPSIALIDLVTDQVVFENWTRWNICDEPFGGPYWVREARVSETSVDPCYSVGPRGAIFPRGENPFLVVGYNLPANAQGNVRIRSIAELISITEAGAVERDQIAEGGLLPYSEDFIISGDWDSDHRTYAFSLIPVDGRLPIPITIPVAVDDYRFWLTDIIPDRNQLRFFIGREPQDEPAWVSARVTVEFEPASAS